MGGLSSFFSNVSKAVKKVTSIAVPLATSYFSGGLINANSGVSGAMNEVAAQPITAPAASAYTPPAVQTSGTGMSTKTMLMIGGGVLAVGILGFFAMRR